MAEAAAAAPNPADDKEIQEEMTYKKAFKYRKYSSYLAAVMLIVVSVLKIMSITEGHKL